MENINVPKEIGVLPLRNSVLFPHAIMPISVGRRKTLNLLDDVVRDSKLIAVVSQKNPSDDDPDPDSDVPGRHRRADPQGRQADRRQRQPDHSRSQARAHRIASPTTEPFMRAEVTRARRGRSTATVELEAMVRSLVNQFQNLVQVSSNISSDPRRDGAVGRLRRAGASLADLAASVLSISDRREDRCCSRSNNVKDRIAASSSRSSRANSSCRRSRAVVSSRRSPTRSARPSASTTCASR